MVFKLGLEAQKHWRRLQGFELIPKVLIGVRFVDGEEQTQQAAQPVILTMMRPVLDTQLIPVSKLFISGEKTLLTKVSEPPQM